MKRNLTHLTGVEIQDIRNWLTLRNKNGICPFGVLNKDTDSTCGKLCKNIFPKLHKSLSGYHSCPCHQFDDSYVTKIAKEIIT